MSIDAPRYETAPLDAPDETARVDTARVDTAPVDTAPVDTQGEDAPAPGRPAGTPRGGHRRSGRSGAAGRSHVARSRGAVSGLALLALGIWGGLAPFVGPSFSYGYSPDESWHWTQWRLYLEVLPAGAAVLGGLILLVTARRASGLLGGWLALLGGVWFAIGLPLAPVLDVHGVGAPIGNETERAWATIGLFTGLGAAIVLFAALALGRLSVVSARDVASAERRGREEDDSAPFFPTEDEDDSVYRYPAAG